MHKANSKIASMFWEKFSKHVDIIEKNILARDHIKYGEANSTVTLIKSELGIADKVGIHFGVDIRNGIQLDERKNHIEMIISPMMQRNNILLVNAIYDELYNKKQLTTRNWSVVKYKFWQPTHLQTMSINYEPQSNEKNGDSEIIEINKDNFAYVPILDEKNSRVNILLFIDDDVSEYLIKKEKIHLEKSDREIFIPINGNIYAMLDSAIGEYNLLNVLGKLEICLKSEHKEIDRHPLEHLTQTVKMINNNPMNDFNTCSRCGYSNKQVQLKVCNCKEAYYCDVVCQRANWKIHKISCNIKT